MIQDCSAYKNHAHHCDGNSCKLRLIEKIIAKMSSDWPVLTGSCAVPFFRSRSNNDPQ